MAQNTLPALDLYRRSFEPSEVLADPYAMIAVQVIAADTDDEAQRLALPGGLAFLRLRQNAPVPLPTVDEAAAYPCGDAWASMPAQVQTRLRSP